jgi:phosphotriesterase-related protein
VAEVQTLTGAVDSSELGFTLMHEHLMLRSENVHEQWPHLEDLDARADEVAEKVREAGRHGIRTIVDATAPNMTRDVPRLRRIAEQTDVNIIYSTGLHPHLPVPFYLKYDAPDFRMDADRIAELFIRDLTVGYGDTGIRAGMLKSGSDPDLGKENEIVLRAVARAHRATGVPITLHSKPKAKIGLMQQDVLEKEGVDLSRVIIAHSGDTTDFAYLTALCERGSQLGMDRFGFDAPGWFRLTVEQRVEVVLEMCRRGFADRMVLSHDAQVWCDFLPEEAQRRYQPRSRLTTVPDEVIPQLARELGEEQVHLLTVGNPRRIFENSEAY